MTLHLVRSVTFGRGYRDGDPAPLVCSCSWSGDAAGWDAHRTGIGQPLKGYHNRRNDLSYDRAFTDHPAPVKPRKRPKLEPRPRHHPVALPEHADRVCRHGHIGEWLLNRKGHLECIVCRRAQRRRGAAA